MAYTEEDLFDMSDEELEAAYKESQAEDEPEPEVTEEEEVKDEPEEESVNEEEEEEENVAEEPEEESDGNSEEDEGEEEVEEASDDDKTEVDEEETEATEDKPEDKPQEVQKRKFKANGQEFEFTDDEIFDQFGKVFAQAMNYTKKMQAIAPYRSMIDSIEEQKLTQEDLNLAIDVLKGDKDALAAVMKRTGVDALDLDGEVSENYQPNNYGRNETELAIKDVVNEISGDSEYAITQHVIDNQWDSKSQDTFVQQPELIKELHLDIKNGVFDKVSPMAMKLKVLDGGRKSDIEYYVEAGQQYYRNQSVEAQQAAEAEAKQAEANRVANEAERVRRVKAENAKKAAEKVTSKKRRAAAPTKSRVQKSVTDYLDESDEAFDEWYKKLQDSY